MAEQQAQPSGPDLTEGVSISQVASGAMLLGHVDGDAVLLARQGDEFFAVGATCSHYSGPLAEGLLAGDTVHCPWHHARFCLRTGEAIGALEPKLALRLLRMIDGGNKYAAGVKSLGDTQVELIIKETFRDPSQTRLSFPATGGEGVRAYTRESLVRMGDDDDDEIEEETENEDWDGEAEPGDGNTVTFSSFQNTIERDVDDDDDGE